MTPKSVQRLSEKIMLIQETIQRKVISL